MVEKYYIEDNANKVITAVTGNAQIVVINNNEFTWSYVDAGAKYTLTGNVLCYDNDTSVLFAEITTPNTYIPIIDGKSDYVFIDMPNTPYTANSNKMLPVFLLILLFSQL